MVLMTVFSINGNSRLTMSIGDILNGGRNDLLTGGFAVDLNGNAIGDVTITTAEQKADIDRRLSSLIDPDIATTVYYRLTTTRFNDINNNTIDAGELE